MNSDTNAPAGLYEFLAWLEINKKRVIIVIVVLVVLGILAYVIRWNAIQQRLEANTALLQLDALPSQAEEPTEPSAFLQIAKDYEGTGAAERAILLAAGSLFVKGEYTEAEKEFDRFLSEHGNGPLEPVGQFGRAAALEARGNRDTALAAYQMLIEQHPEHPLVPQAKLSMARIHQMEGRLQGALQLYDSLTTTNFAGWASEASTRRERLLAEHPELAGTNAPASAIDEPAPTPAIDATAPSVPAPSPTNSSGEAAPEPQP